MSGQQILGLLGYHLVTLAAYYVHNSLCTYNLGGRSYQRALAEVLTYTRNLLQYLVVLVGSAQILQLGCQVGQHTARYLIQQGLDINAQVLRVQQAALQSLVTHGTEVIRDLSKKLLIISCIIGSSLEGFNHNLGCRLGSSQSEGRHGAVDDVYAGLYCL